MARVNQFAKDLGISRNQAKNLINKGRSRKDGGSQILESVMKKPVMAKKGKMYSNDAQASNKNKNKKTSKQIVEDINEFNLTKSDITASIDREFSRKVAKQNEDAMKNVKKTNKKKDGGFPDLTGDGKVTKKDILKGRGVPGFSRGGGMAIQGLGFRGVR
tara:strand:- start:880 stop:1359 length:480 start_codon:yes stop_codon:yes gene_type:complete